MPFNQEISKDSMGKPFDVSAGGAIVCKHGVLINIRIYPIHQQIFQMSVPKELWVLRSASNKTVPQQGVGHEESVSNLKWMDVIYQNGCASRPLVIDGMAYNKYIKTPLTPRIRNIVILRNLYFRKKKQ